MNIDKLDLATAQYILHLRNQLQIAEDTIEVLLKERYIDPLKMPVAEDEYILDLTDEITTDSPRTAAINADIRL